jgi:Thioesterase-like superfamily
MAADHVRPGQWIDQFAGGLVHPPHELWGFGGLHGGLTLALLTKLMHEAESESRIIRSTTGRFHQPITGAFSTKVFPQRIGRTAAEAVIDGRQESVLASASLVSGSSRPPSLPPLAPEPPQAPPPTDCERFVVPAEFVPISVFLDVRPVGINRPYAGGSHPELTAWLRLTEDDMPPDPYRLILLMDALAPSYAAILTSPRPIPTVELTVQAADGLRSATSPWILLHASTTSASADGWLHEHLDAWDPTGLHLASADQLRTVAPATTHSNSSSNPDTFQTQVHESEQS